MAKIKLNRWNPSTAIRNPERIPGFFFVFEKHFEGKIWNNENQEKFQIELIRYKKYKPTGMTQEQSMWFDENENPMSLIQANKIWAYQRDELKKVSFQQSIGYYGYRGRMSANPFLKFGLYYKNEENKITITDLGKKLAKNEITIDDCFVSTLLKYQIPLNQEDTGNIRSGFSIKPLIAGLHLIKKVNEIWEEKQGKQIGISRLEFGLFVNSLINAKNIKTHAEKLIKFRMQYKKSKTMKEKRILCYKTILDLNYHLTDKEKKKVTKEELEGYYDTLTTYGENTRRYFRMAGWIRFRGAGNTDLNDRKKVETESLLKFDNGGALNLVDDEEYARYLADTTKPVWPWKTKEKLIEKYLEISKNIKNIKSELSTSTEEIKYISKIELEKYSETDIEKINEELKRKLEELDKEVVLKEMESPEEISNVIERLDINWMRKEAPRQAFVEFEYQTTRGLIALDDGQIEPNYPKGDDGQPISHAPGGGADIECFYDKFNMICEVTLLTNQEQWKREYTAITEHFEDFIEKNKKNKNILLFIAPSIHDRTAKQFYTNNQWDEKVFGRAIPITISQFIEILKTLKFIRERKSSDKITHEQILVLYQMIIDSMKNFMYKEWRQNIQSIIDKWIQEILV